MMQESQPLLPSPEDDSFSALHVKRLRGQTVSLTGLAPGSRDAMAASIRAMGGIYSASLTKNVTLLVCDYEEKVSWGDAEGKYCAAINRMPTVSLTSAAYLDALQLADGLAAPPRPASYGICCDKQRLFEHFRFVMTSGDSSASASAAQRLELKRTIEAHGGVISDDFDARCNCLLLDEGATVSVGAASGGGGGVTPKRQRGVGKPAVSKLCVAAQNGIRICRVSWLQQCVAHQSIFDPSDTLLYAVDPRPILDAQTPIARPPKRAHGAPVKEHAQQAQQAQQAQRQRRVGFDPVVDVKSDGGGDTAATAESVDSGKDTSPLEGVTVSFFAKDFSAGTLRSAREQLRALGGTECTSHSDVRCTHVCSPSYHQRFRMSEGGRGEPLDLEPHLVLPSWLEECARGQYRAAETQHLLPIRSLVKPRPIWKAEQPKQQQPKAPSGGASKSKTASASKNASASKSRGGGTKGGGGGAKPSSSKRGTAKKRRGIGRSGRSSSARSSRVPTP